MSGDSKYQQGVIVLPSWHIDTPTRMQLWHRRNVCVQKTYCVSVFRYCPMLARNIPSLAWLDRHEQRADCPSNPLCWMNKCVAYRCFRSVESCFSHWAGHNLFDIKADHP